MKTAIIFGATGFVGSYLLNGLLQHPQYDKVIVVVRKTLNRTDPKLTELIGDIDSLPQLKNLIIGNHVFIAIGTTKKKTPDEKLYYKIDHDYPVQAATIAKENGAVLVSLVSAVGANSDSNLFYIKTKGTTERDIIALDFRYTQIFRPSMIMGSRTEKRLWERFFIGLFAMLNPLFGQSKYRGIDAENIAQAMIKAAENPNEGVGIFHWKEMNELN